MKERRIRYYQSFADDFEASANQNITLPEDYSWIRKGAGSKILSSLLYGLAVLGGGLYCRLVLRMRVRGREKLKWVRGGFFLYGNHTQPVGDVFIPALCLFPRRIYTVVSPANYGIPVIGRLLPWLGALPVTGTIHGAKKLQDAIKIRLEEGHPIVIYPEGHVWAYYTGIRPFPETSFHFPAKFQVPAFAMTVTYKRTRWRARPRMEVFLDGPFYPQGETGKERARSLHCSIRQALEMRSQNSDVEFIEYKSR